MFVGLAFGATLGVFQLILFNAVVGNLHHDFRCWELLNDIQRQAQFASQPNQTSEPRSGLDFFSASSEAYKPLSFAAVSATILISLP